MTLDRTIALVFLTLCLIYGYAAYFVMDAELAPFMKRNPVWPSTFPKVLAVLGIVSAFWVAITAKAGPVKEDGIDYRRLRDYKIGQAAALIGLMTAYALALFPFGFIVSTVLFITLGAFTLGERKLHIVLPVAGITAGSLWYLVQEVLGIFLRPWPFFAGL